jgi:hypothetical protein
VLNGEILDLLTDVRTPRDAWTRILAAATAEERRAAGAHMVAQLSGLKDLRAELTAGLDQLAADHPEIADAWPPRG